MALLGPLPAVSAATTAPDFHLTDLDGDDVRLSDLQGTPVILDFMATWCDSCHSTIKGLLEVYEDKSGSFEVISIAIDPTESEDQLRDYVTKYGIPWTMARDTDSVQTKYSVSAISYLVGVNARGTIVWTAVAHASEEEIREGVSKIMADDAPGIDLPELNLYTVAIIFGVLSFFSPCAFPMLPGYMSYYLGLDASGRSAAEAARSVDKREVLRRGAIGGLAAGSGILLIFAGIGGLVVATGGLISPYVPHLGLVVGGLLAILGALMLANVSFSRLFDPIVNVLQRRSGAAPSDPDAPQGPPSPRKLFVYGIGYGAAAAGCVAPLLLGLSVAALSEGLTGGLILIALYAGTAAALMVAVTVGVAAAGASVARRLNRLLPWVNRLAAVALIIAGAYLIIFWYLTWGTV